MSACACRCHAYSTGITCDQGPVQPGGNRSCTWMHGQTPSAVPTVEAILADLDSITDAWPDLVEHRQPGTPRPWRQALIDPERRAAIAKRDAEERAGRDPDAPGFTSAPQHLDVLDTIIDTWVTLDELVALISPDWRRSRTAGALDRKAAEYGPAPVTDIEPMVAFIRTWLADAADQVNPARLDRIARRLEHAVTETNRQLGLIRAGQLLNGALCPWCKGTTPKHPEGGAVTMRVEEIPGSRTLGVEAAAAVVCWNPLCTPPEVDCGTWFRGRPAWPWHEWEWLADRLIIADPPASSLLDRRPRFADGRPYELVPLDHSGRSGLARAQAC